MRKCSGSQGACHRSGYARLAEVLPKLSRHQTLLVSSGSPNMRLGPSGSSSAYGFKHFLTDASVDWTYYHLNIGGHYEDRISPQRVLMLADLVGG
jgi:hypothetical protein